MKWWLSRHFGAKSSRERKPKWLSGLRVSLEKGEGVWELSGSAYASTPFHMLQPVLPDSSSHH